MRGLCLVEVCSSNRACVPELFDLEAQFLHMSIVEIDCMNECEQCELGPYVFMDGEITTAKDVPSLLELLKQSAIGEPQDLL